MELLPCPFCGGEALPTAHLTYNWFAPVCRRCNARGPSVKIERDSDPQEMRNLMNQADENWNRRASPASAPEGWKDFLQDLTQKISEAMDHTPDSFHREMVTFPPPSKETLEAAGHRLALELECLLLDCKDNVVVSRWMDTACEALDAWRNLFPYNGPRLGD